MMGTLYILTFLFPLCIRDAVVRDMLSPSPLASYRDPHKEIELFLREVQKRVFVFDNPLK